MAQETQRKVYFYRAYRGLDAAGRPLAFNAHQALAAIQALKFRKNENYMDEGDGNVICCWVDRLTPCVRARIARVRRAALPLVEEEGDLKPLNIPATSGLAESVHLVFFPNNVVGFLYNHFGPRISRVAHYIRDRTGGLSEHLRFDPLLMPDVFEQLDRVREVRAMSLRLRRSVVEEIDTMDESVRTVVQGAVALGDAERIELILRPEPYSGESLGARARAAVRKLARREDIARISDRFVIDASTDNGHEPIDILSSYVVSQQKVVTLNKRTRGLDDASAYEAIERAYAQLEETITRAAAVWQPHE